MEDIVAKNVVIGTAGHVDHGKTTLTFALTGVNTDRWAEEQARGMTIDLGFAFLELGGDPPIHASIVDVPGHERFVKNMLAGTGGVDVALVVVAADEGVMPQTREHLDVLTVLGVAHGVVAVTKSDIADADLLEIAVETVREALANTPLERVPIIPVSAQTGDGIPALRDALRLAALAAPSRKTNAPFRLPVDRVFSLAGAGTVVTGTLTVGTLQTGDAVRVMPHRKETKARTLQAHKTKIEKAVAGMRVAVNIPGVEVAEIERGAVLCAPNTLVATTLFDAHLQILSNATRPVKNRERVRVHLGTGEILARVQLIDRDEAKPGDENVPAQLLCETEAAPARGERFVLRTYSPAHVFGGGTILDPNPQVRRRKHDPAAVTLFHARETGEITQNIYAALVARHEERSPAEIAAAIGAEQMEVSAALDTLVSENRVVRLDTERYLSDVAATRLRETVKRLLATYHRQHPLKSAMHREALRAPLAKAAVANFDAVLPYLARTGEIAFDEKGNVHAPDHHVVLSPTWEAARSDMLAVYCSAGLNPPAVNNFQAHLPRDVNVRSILGVLCDRGDLVSLGDDLYLSSESFASAVAVIKALAQQTEAVTVGQVRDATGSSRKVILALMEYLDAQHLTLRQGDARVWIG